VDEVREQANGIRAEAQAEVAGARADAERLRAEAGTTARRCSTRPGKRSPSNLAEAREQTAWTQQTIADLLAAAEADAANIRQGANA